MWTPRRIWRRSSVSGTSWHRGSAPRRSCAPAGSARGGGRSAPAGSRSWSSVARVAWRGSCQLASRRGAMASTTNWHTPEFAPIAEDEDALAELVEAALARATVRLDLSFLYEGSAIAETCARLGRGAGFRLLAREIQRSPYLETTDDWDTFRSGLPSRKTSKYRRFRRRLDEQGQVTIEAVDGGERLEELLQEGLKVEAAGLEGRRGEAILDRPETTRFYSEVAEWAAARGWLRLSFLRLDGMPIAFAYGLEHDGVYWDLKLGFDPGYARFGPGVLLMEERIRHAFTTPLKRFEFLGGDEPTQAGLDGRGARQAAVPGLRAEHRRRRQQDRVAARPPDLEALPAQLARRCRQLAGQALGVAGGADLREQAVRLAELSLAPLLVAALVRQLGELDVDQRLVRLRRPCRAPAPAPARAPPRSPHARRARPSRAGPAPAPGSACITWTWRGRGRSRAPPRPGPRARSASPRPRYDSAEQREAQSVSLDRRCGALCEIASERSSASIACRHSPRIRSARPSQSHAQDAGERVPDPLGDLQRLLGVAERGLGLSAGSTRARLDSCGSSRPSRCPPARGRASSPARSGDVASSSSPRFARTPPLKPWQNAYGQPTVIPAPTVGSPSASSIARSSIATASRYSPMQKRE